MSFEDGALVFGGILIGGALLSGMANRSVLSLAALFVLTGFVLGHGGLEVIELDAESAFVEDLAVIALIVILFRDGLEVDAEMLQKEWHLPLRKLVLAMPVTAGLVAVAVAALTSLSWTEAFLVGVLLAPTDPVLSSNVITNPRVPRIVRHSLNLESGMNDGLALPAVLALAAALSVENEDFTWWEFVGQDIGLGLLFGVGMGFLAAAVMSRGKGLYEETPTHQKALFVLGVAFATYGVAVIEPHGNGFIAVFSCAIVFGIRRPDLARTFEHQSGDIVEIVKLGVFVVFGSLLTLEGLFDDGWAAVAIVAFTLLVARPLAVAVALAGTKTDAATRAFMAWFGPKGVATMTFSLLILGEAIPDGERIFHLAALTVFVSVLVHGLTDTHGARWMADRAEAAEAQSAAS